jgi:hypothetical protein
MDGLDEFEKSLAAEKAERERAVSSSRSRHRHRDHDDYRRSNHRDRSSERSHKRNHRDEGHIHKRRKSGDSEEQRSEKRHRHGNRHHERRPQHEPSEEKNGDAHLDLPLPDDEETPDIKSRTRKTEARDAWMTDPSAIEIDYVQRAKAKPPPMQKEEPRRVLHARELNQGLAQAESKQREDKSPPSETSYVFGDEGSQWRLTKLRGVYATAKEKSLPVDEIGAEHFGSLQDFDAVREEEIEMDRRKTYGEGYVGKQKPTGELYHERKDAQIRTKDSFEQLGASDISRGDASSTSQAALDAAQMMDQSTLNRLRAQLMKARLRKSPDLARLQAEYDAACNGLIVPGQANDAVVLDVMQNRMLAGPRGEVSRVDTRRGRERRQVKQNEEMSIDDMVREERRTRGQAGGEGMRLAERIAKDAKFDDDLDYMDENADMLATRVHKSEINLKNIAVSEYQKLNKILDKCPLCHHEDRPPPQDQPIAPVVSLATRVFLTLSTEPELSGAEGGAVIVPIAHRKNLLECDDDEWEEMRNFMKSLTRLYHEQGREVLFYENAAAPQRHLHAALVVVPIPYDLGETAPAFFREAMLSSDEEWSQHKKIIDTAKKAREGLGKLAFRRTLAKEMPYFHVWFNLDGGLGHIVEDAERWPKGDLFAREIIGGMLDARPDVIKRQGRWNRSDPRLEDFRKRWRKFDWTRVLTEG